MAVCSRRGPGLTFPLRCEFLRWPAAAGRRRAGRLTTALCVRAAEPLRVLERHTHGDRKLSAAAGFDVRRAEEGALRRVGELRVGRVTVRRREDPTACVLPAGKLSFDRTASIG